jgi:enamine deaminase RidA (YjgF/YER057c/UK114 family)
MIKRFKESNRLSQAVVHNGVAYLTGQVADDENAGIQEQTKQVLGKIDALLKLCGTEKKNLLAVQVWLSDIRYFDEMNRIWEEWIASHSPPSRATVESRLARPGLKVEMRAIAAVE